MQPLKFITSEESPREILAADFKSLNGPLPIRGGWGYTKSDACIIDKNDPLVDSALPFDGVGLEYIFVEKRIYEEMIIFRPETDRFYGIHWKLKKQNVVQEAERTFDRLIFEITAFLDDDWWEIVSKEASLKGTPHTLDKEVIAKKYKEKSMHFTREFWFDITSFCGK